MTVIRAWLDRNILQIYAAILAILLGALAVAPSIFIDIPAGHVGVLWMRFFGGTVTEHVYSEGIHAVFPWDTMTLYDARLRNTTRSYTAVTSNGMQLKVDVALRFRINAAAAGYLHKHAGPDYDAVLVYPKIASLIFELAAHHTPEEFYSSQRNAIQNDLIRLVRAAFPAPLNSQDVLHNAPAPGMVLVDDVLISGVTLPDSVVAAINRKIEQQQVMQEYDFRLERETKERDRKRIEAEGVRDFQAIVARSITPEYLRLRGIEATTALATSPNAKTIVIGGRDGLPLILNTGELSSESTAPR